MLSFVAVAVAVAHRLVARGHRVELVVPTSCHQRIAAEGLIVRSAGCEVGPDELAALELDWSLAGAGWC